MKLSSSPRRKVGLVGTIVTALGLLASGQALALTEAGQSITNEATVSYQDALGNNFSATSNEAVVTVAAVFAATLEQDRTRTGAPGSTVYFQHFLRNTGNETDTYTIATFVDADRNGVADDSNTDSDYAVFVDTNGNGEPNSGEPAILDPTGVAPGSALGTAGDPATITLDAGETANLLLAFSIPGGASNGSFFGATILATSANLADGANPDGRVNDLTAANSGTGNDSLEGTNNDRINVTTGPVLNLVKNATFEENDALDPSDDTILYTLTVTNLGGSTATNVDIIDVIPENTAFVPGSIVLAGLSQAADLQMTGATSGGDAVLQATSTGTPGAFAIDEEDVGLDASGLAESLDFNQNDSENETGLTAIYFRDATLGQNVTVSVTYRVAIDDDLNAGVPIDNVFIADDTESPVVTVLVPQVFDVDARDTGDEPTNTASPGVNNGADDDTGNDVQFVDVVADGSTVIFRNIIRNDGNGPDVFELSINNTTIPTLPEPDAGACTTNFPAGTSFQFFNAANTASLANTNSQFSTDTGLLDRDEEITITVRASLPSGVSGTGPYCATLTARSFGAGTTTPVVDTKIESVGAIAAPTLDLANTFAAAGLNDSGAVDADPDSAVTTLATVAAGSVQEFELFIANEGVSADSYDLTSANVPAGWNVSFIQRGVHTNPTVDATLDVTTNAGSTVTTTPLLPPGAIYQYTARVQTSSVPAQSLANAPSSGGVNTDENSDSDLDYVLTFTATSTTNGTISNSKRDAIDIADDPAIEVTPDSQDQVQPGGSVDYANTITNTGNVTLNATVTLTHSLAGFDNTTLIDTDGDGIGDTELGNLTDGSTITVSDGSGNPALDTDDDQLIDVSIDGSGNPVFTLLPGQVIPLDITVQAPANAAQGDEDFFVIDATDAVEGASDIATDRTEVVTVQVRLDKTVAVDPVCSCDPTTLTFPPIAASGVTQASTDVEPGECVVWLLTATNQSTQSALNVTINDSVTAFTTLRDPNGTSGDGDDGALFYQGPADAGLTSVTAIDDADAGEVIVSDIIFTVGPLASGESAAGSFCVVVD